MKITASLFSTPNNLYFLLACSSVFSLAASVLLLAPHSILELHPFIYFLFCVSLVITFAVYRWVQSTEIYFYPDHIKVIQGIVIRQTQRIPYQEILRITDYKKESAYMLRRKFTKILLAFTSYTLTVETTRKQSIIIPLHTWDESAVERAKSLFEKHLGKDKVFIDFQDLDTYTRLH